jgi:hypothetical protein
VFQESLGCSPEYAAGGSQVVFVGVVEGNGVPEGDRIRQFVPELPARVGDAQDTLTLIHSVGRLED